MAKKVASEESGSKKSKAKGAPEGYEPKKKPKLTKDQQRSMNIRAKRKAMQPEFKRQEWFRYEKLGERWKKPRGMHSKTRKHLGYRPNVASIGFGAPAAVRGRHPSGFQEILVYRPADLEKLDPDSQAARIGGTVGEKKRAAITEKADELGIRILNRRD